MMMTIVPWNPSHGVRLHCTGHCTNTKHVTLLNVTETFKEEKEFR